MTFKPMHDLVVIKRVEEEQKGFVIIPDSAKVKSQIGEVMEVGPGLKDFFGQFVPLHVKVGDRILIDKFTGREIRIEEQEFLLIPEKDILGIFE